MHLPDLFWPSREDERKDPKKADETYSSSTAYLLERSRNAPNAALIAEELADYGLRRNLFGIRRLAFLLSALGALVVSARSLGLLGIPPPELVTFWPAALAVLAVYFVLFALGTTSDWVRKQADEYARRLFACCEMLEVSTTKQQHVSSAHVMVTHDQ